LAFVNSKIKVLTPSGYCDISSLQEGDKVVGDELHSYPIKELLHRPMPEDDRSVKIRELYSTGRFTYENLGEQFKLSAASICHVIKGRVGYDCPIITVGHSPYNKDHVQVTPGTRFVIPVSDWTQGWEAKRAIDLKEDDELFIVQKNRDTGELEITAKPIVFLEKKIIRARKLWDFSLAQSSEHQNRRAFCAKGILLFDGDEK